MQTGAEKEIEQGSEVCKTRYNCVTNLLEILDLKFGQGDAGDNKSPNILRSLFNSKLTREIKL